MKIVRLRGLGKALPTITLICLFGGMLPGISHAQSAEPQREQLLNGLRILLISRPGDKNVLLKLRIHSGAAFDTAGKVGTMALLGDILFPDAATHDYFTEEIGGRLEVETDYDGINVTLQGPATDYDRIVDILRTALVTTQLTPENVAKVREARIKRLTAVQPTVANMADRVIAERLFGNFPYANPSAGEASSLARVDRADLMVAREKFLNPNNATLVIIGGVDQRRALRALRQLLGGWRKSDQLIPASFRQPAQPDPRTLIVNSPGTQTAEVRLATRGLARGDRDYFAANVLAAVARERWQRLGTDSKSSFLVNHEAHLLPGIFVMRATVEATAVAKSLENGRNILKSLVDSPVLSGELEKAKSETAALMNSRLSPDDATANAWLDVEAYTLGTINEQMRALNSISVTDLQRVAVRLFRNTAVASVVVGSAEDLKAQLTPTLKIEMMGESKPKPAEPESTTTTTEPARKQHVPILIAPKNPNPLMKTTKPVTKP